MKAAFIERTGPPDVIRYGDLPEPALDAGSALIRVKAVCVNPVDCYVRAGLVRLELDYPYIIGRDMVGVVEAVGAAVTRFVPGTRVWCNNQGYHGRTGTFAERLAIPETLLYQLPDGVDEHEMVAFAHSGLTAMLGLEILDLNRGETLLVNGGSGNVGSAVVQLAAAGGVNVIATAGSERGLAWCRSLGAVAANYRSSAFRPMVQRASPGGVDAYWDTSGKPDFDLTVDLLRRGGRAVTMAGFTARPDFPIGPFCTKNGSLHGFAATFVDEPKLAAVAGQLNQWASRGSMRVRIDRILPLREAAEAHRLVETGAPLAGKILLTPQ